jgi:hypothetical protein
MNMDVGVSALSALTSLLEQRTFTVVEGLPYLPSARLESLPHSVQTLAPVVTRGRDHLLGVMQELTKVLGGALPGDL